MELQGVIHPFEQNGAVNLHAGDTVPIATEPAQTEQ
jgi:hypothetical protein